MNVISKCKEFCQNYKQNPIKNYEDYFGIKFTKFQKVKLKIYNNFIRYLEKIIYEESEMLNEILIEPYGTARYEILKLHLVILGLKVDLIKEIFKNI